LNVLSNCFKKQMSEQKKPTSAQNGNEDVRRMRRAVQLGFCLNLAYKLMEVVYLKRKSFYLIEPFVLYARPGLLFNSFTDTYYRLKSS